MCLVCLFVRSFVCLVFSLVGLLLFCLFVRLPVGPPASVFPCFFFASPLPSLAFLIVCPTRRSFAPGRSLRHWEASDEEPTHLRVAFLVPKLLHLDHDSEGFALKLVFEVCFTENDSLHCPVRGSSAHCGESGLSGLLYFVSQNRCNDSRVGIRLHTNIILFWALCSLARGHLRGEAVGHVLRGLWTVSDGSNPYDLLECTHKAIVFEIVLQVPACHN
mmetsp:Transcript_11385/g.17159  ORF Transcript_11385/g.17159 Transcript_11385/m.17159 type:complete len:218 (-) Transcript_11385:364-1017(-)